MRTDSDTYASLLRWCGNAKSLLDGERTHAHIIKFGVEGDLVLRKLLIQMYAKCGALEKALLLFAKLQDQSVLSWNFMIRECVQQHNGKDAFQLFERMLQEGILPEKVIFLGIFSACSTHALLTVGKRLHARIIARALDLDVVTSTALVNMYGKCGSLYDARMVFSRMTKRDVVMWTSMVAVYAYNGRCDDACQLFNIMQQEGILPDKITFISLLDACAKHAALSEGKRIHTHILDGGIQIDVVVGTALFNMYGKCGQLKNAQDIFHKIPKQNVLSWTAMISVHAQHGHCLKAFQLFEQMQPAGVMPNKVTFINVLAACYSPEMLPLGKWVHAFIVEQELELDVVVGNTLVDMYGKCGSLGDAWKMFLRMPVRDVVSWTSMMAILTQHGLGNQTLQLFDEMQQDRILPDRVTFASILDACSSHGSLSEGKQMHAYILDRGFESDVVVGNALVNMYGKCSTLENARRMFDSMVVRDVISWNAIISLYAQQGNSKEVLRLFDQMQVEGVQPDKVTFMNILGSEYAKPLANGDCRRIHTHIIENRFESNPIVGTALISMYCKCGSLEKAHWLFDRMHKQDVISWNAMLAGYAQNGDDNEAWRLFLEMQEEGFMPDKFTFIIILAACASQVLLTKGKQIHARVVDSKFDSEVIIGNALVSMYGKCGSLQDACWMFDKITDHNIISWNAIVDVHAHHGNGKEACELLEQMQVEGVVPNEVTFVSMLVACSHSGLLDEGSNYFISMKHNFGITPGVDHYVCMIDLFGRAGCLDEAENTLKCMPIEPTSVTFMALLVAYRDQDDVERGERVVDTLCNISCYETFLR